MTAAPDTREVLLTLDAAFIDSPAALDETWAMALAALEALRAMDRPTLLRALGMEQRKLFTNFHRSPTKGIVAYDGVEAWVEP